MSGYLNAEGKTLWKAARDAGIHGINWEQAEKVTGKTGTQLRSRVNNMVAAGYLNRIGEPGQSIWVIGRKVPYGLTVEGHPDDEHGDDEDPPPREAVKGVPPGVANSVFQLGALMGGAAAAPAAAEPPPAPAPAPAPGQDLSSWKPAKALQSAAEFVAAVEEHQAKTEPAKPMFFALTSKDEFVISRNTGEEMLVLDPATTRAMFAWLDRLGGLGLVDKLTEPEAA